MSKSALSFQPRALFLRKPSQYEAMAVSSWIRKRVKHLACIAFGPISLTGLAVRQGPSQIRVWVDSTQVIPATRFESPSILQFSQWPFIIWPMIYIKSGSKYCSRHNHRNDKSMSVVTLAMDSHEYSTVNGVKTVIPTTATTAWPCCLLRGHVWFNKFAVTTTSNDPR